MRCTSYSNRTEVEHCVLVRPFNVDLLHKNGILPDSCAYVRWNKGLPQKDPPEYKLIPFSMANPNIGEKYIKIREANLKLKRRKNEL